MYDYKVHVNRFVLLRNIMYHGAHIFLSITLKICTGAQCSPFPMDKHAEANSV